MVLRDVAIRSDVERVLELKDGSRLGRLEVKRVEELLNKTDV